jgi:hypothetical protein
MDNKHFHMRFRDVVSVNLLFAALEKNFPLFRSTASASSVNLGGKNEREKVFLTLKGFSTSFPQKPVDVKH